MAWKAATVNTRVTTGGESSALLVVPYEPALIEPALRVSLTLAQTRATSDWLWSDWAALWNHGRDRADGLVAAYVTLHAHACKLFSSAQPFALVTASVAF